MSVWNEYSELKTVLLGKRFDEKIVRDQFNGQNDLIQSMAKINNETNDDLDQIQEYLEKNNVKVYRPDINKYWELKEEFNTTDICDPGAIRDWCFAYGDTIILTNLSFPQRRFEHYFWEDTFLELQKTKNIISNRYCLNRGSYDIKYDKLFESNEQIESIKNNLIEENKIMFCGIINRCDKYLNEKKKIDDAFYNYFLNENYKNKNFLHAASYLKHDNIIFAGPQGSKNGIISFEKNIKSIYPQTQFVYTGEMNHLDGYQTIVDINLIIRNIDASNHIELNSDKSYLGINALNIPPSIDNTTFNEPYITNYVDKKFTNYLQNLQGYDQRVDFDLNSLTISPKKIISGIFNSEKLKLLEKFDIETVNIPMRHRWMLDGGIHCYTVDIDRTND